MRNAHPIPSSRMLSSAVIGALLLLGACQSNKAAEKPAAPAAPLHATISNEISATAEVVTVDSTARVVTLRREDGSLMQVKAGDSVRNFAQIAVGDTLRVQYKESLEATRRPAGEAAVPAQAVAAAARAEAGAKPGGGVGVAISVRVKIESLDLERNIVVFSLASGELSARRVATPEGREFIKGLKVGDTVQLDYTEALALSIEEL